MIPKRSGRAGGLGPVLDDCQPRGPMLVLQGRALVRLDGGQYVCVDLASLDALPYVFGIAIEPDVIPVFKTFLRPDSVVLDIGANFGLYTSLAGSVVARRGRLYAFEANPSVYRCLIGTIVANRLWPTPRVTAANMLVGDRCGRGTLYYVADMVGGGTMSDLPIEGQERKSVEVEMTTIDAYLPPDTVVDLVKIDVEGHEPSVIRGMEQTIARSPDIRLIVEVVPGFLEHTTDIGAFFASIRRLGLEICRILPNSRLQPVQSHNELPDFGYCLVTRTPQRDSAAVETHCNSLTVRVGRWRRKFLPRRRHRPLGWRL